MASASCTTLSTAPASSEPPGAAVTVADPIDASTSWMVLLAGAASPAALPLGAGAPSLRACMMKRDAAVCRVRVASPASQQADSRPGAASYGGWCARVVVGALAWLRVICRCWSFERFSCSCVIAFTFLMYDLIRSCAHAAQQADPRRPAPIYHLPCCCCGAVLTSSPCTGCPTGDTPCVLRYTVGVGSGDISAYSVDLRSMTATGGET
jgi:hypothetical protein